MVGVQDPIVTSACAGVAQTLGGKAWKCVRGAFIHLIAFALPPRCPGCGAIVADDHLFCLGCWGTLDMLGGPACAVCAEPLGAMAHYEARCGAWNRRPFRSR